MKELAADGIPVAVRCRVLKLARQPYYRWLANPVADAEYLEAHRANALFGGFNPSSQHRVVNLSVVGLQALPPVFSTRVSCGAGC